MTVVTELNRDGAVSIAAGQHPYTSYEMKELVEICEGIPIAKGFSESGLVFCGRIKIDNVDVILESSGGDNRRVYNSEAADRILAILSKPEAMSYWQNVLRSSKLELRRAQTNILPSGGYIAKHSDAVSNPDYVASVIIGLSEKYTGGEYIVYKDGDAKTMKLGDGTVFLTLNGAPHEVTKVTSGLRESLVFMLSEMSDSQTV